MISGDCCINSSRLLSCHRGLQTRVDTWYPPPLLLLLLPPNKLCPCLVYCLLVLFVSYTMTIPQCVTASDYGWLYQYANGYTSVWIVCNYISDVGHHNNGQLPPIATELMKCLRPCDVMGETSSQATSNTSIWQTINTDQERRFQR